MSRSPSETNETHLADGFPAAKLEQWRALVDKALKGADFEKRLVRRTADGLKINPLYTRDDALANAADALPGYAPFTRGTKSVSGGWDIRTFHIESDPKAANAAILEDLEGGVTSIGLQVGMLMAGAILTETIFSWPGVGKWMIDSISKRDYVAVQSGLLLIALVVMAVNLIVDLLYAVINPRIRVQ